MAGDATDCPKLMAGWGSMGVGEVAPPAGPNFPPDENPPVGMELSRRWWLGAGIDVGTGDGWFSTVSPLEDMVRGAPLDGSTDTDWSGLRPAAPKRLGEFAVGLEFARFITLELERRCTASRSRAAQAALEGRIIEGKYKK